MGIDANTAGRYSRSTDDAALKGGKVDERFTTEVARRVVGELISRIEKGEVMARRKKKETEEDEIDSIVDDLDEIEDEVDDDEDEVEDVDGDEDDDEDEDDEDPDEAPKAKRGKKSKVKAKKSKAAQDGVGTKEVAEEAGIDSRQLRMFLRAKGYQPKDDRDGRYHWKSLNDKEVQRILKDIKGGAVEKMNKEKLDKLKGKKSKKGSSKKASAKKSKRAKANA